MLDGIDKCSKSLDFSVGLCLKTGEVLGFANTENANELRAAIKKSDPVTSKSFYGATNGFRSGLGLGNLIEERMHKGDTQTFFFFQSLSGTSPCLLRTETISK